MSSDRLTQKIYENEKRIKGAWYRNLYGICESINAQELLSCNHIIHIGNARNRLLESYQEVLTAEMSKTSKLSNYVQISDVTSAAAHVKCNLDKGK